MNECINGKLYQLFLEVQWEQYLIGSVLLQEETETAGENLECLIESKWKHSEIKL